MRILVVDDDETTRSELADLLHDDRYEVATAESGEAALEAVRAQPPDVALVDLRMSGMDGVETLRQLRALSPTTGVVLITGHASVDTAVDAMKSGAFDYILKPFELEAIHSVLRSFEEQRNRSAFLGETVLALDALIDAFLVAANRGGLCLFDVDLPLPLRVSRAPRIRTVRVGRGAAGVRPANLATLSQTVDDFLREGGSAILVACLRPLIAAQGAEKMTTWLRMVAERARERGVVLIVAASDDRERAIGQRVQTSIANVRQQSILESLSNPIRRGIVQFLAAAGSATYSEILRARFVDSSPKLSFHLQKLTSDGVAAKRPDGKYALTAEGARAARLAAAIGASEGRPVVVSVGREPGDVNRS